MSIHLNGFPFDSQITGYGSDGLPEYDRASNSLELSTLIRSFWRNGIFGTGALTVMAGGGMTVTVSTGSVLVQGRVAHVTTQKTLAFDSASSNPRFDRVVVRCDLSNAVRDLVLDVVKGIPAISPVAPALTRNESIWELCLATVRIVEGATSINQSMITDTRTDANLCGIVAATMTEVDTDRFYAQVQSDLESFRENEQSTMSAFFADKRSEFDLWFESIKDLLDESAASKLTAQLLEKASANSEIVSLSPSAWTESGEKFTQQVPCSIASAGVNDVYIVSPVPTSIDEYSNCGIFASEFISGYVFFTAKNKPDNTLLANVVEIEKGISGGFSMNSVATPIIEEKLGEMVSVSDAAERPAVELTSYIESPQNGDDTLGWDVVILEKIGKNILYRTGSLPLTRNGITFSDAGDGKISVRGTATANANFSIRSYSAGNRTRIEAGTYTLTGGDENAKITLIVYESQDATQNIASATSSSLTQGAESVFTVPSGGGYFGVYVTVSSGKTANCILQPQIEVGSTASMYEPYNVTTIESVLPETVYRGMVEWVTGTVTSISDANGNDLAEPKVLHITPRTINLTKGKNSFRSNAGDIRLVYAADTKLYVDEKIATLAAAILRL